MATRKANAGSQGFPILTAEDGQRLHDGAATNGPDTVAVRWQATIGGKSIDVTLTGMHGRTAARSKRRANNVTRELLSMAAAAGVDVADLKVSVIANKTAVKGARNVRGMTAEDIVISLAR